ncbi:MAG: DUF1285 domain-containing protein [Syntrophales bacterium]|nr:DUF1285 domain-containing protein [Syntrophales bacterium]
MDTEGVWYYKGVEMTRRDIVNYFYQNLKQDQTGRYLIELENERCYLDVEDTPFVVKAVLRSVSKSNEEEAIYLLLSDDTLERLDPHTLWIGNDNVLYCTIKNHRLNARFLRAGYYQLASGIEYDAQKDAYFISLNGHRYYISGKCSVS